MVALPGVHRRCACCTRLPSVIRFHDAAHALSCAQLPYRNITLTGPAGSNSSIDAAPQIDLQNRVGILELCSSCLFRILGVSLANDNRAGAQGGTSAFRGQPGSRIEWVTGVGLRLACPPTAEQLPLVKATARSPLFPSPAGGQQLAITNFTYRVRTTAWGCCWCWPPW